MNVILIQPPDPPKALKTFEPSLGQRGMISPPWELQCVRSYLLNRTRHQCSILDARLFTDLESEFLAGIKALGTPDLLVVQTSTQGLGQSAAVLDIARRHFPYMHLAICGQHPSQFPTHESNLDRADFALCGDPEPILRNLLDYMGVEQRLSRIPGLVYKGSKERAPYWLTDLKSLSLPDWEGVYWGAYEISALKPILRATLRLSRGHTHTLADRAQGRFYEPFREWPVERVAPLLAKCIPKGVTEVFLDDPPGMWTLTRIVEWCTTLERIHNPHAWAMRLLPAAIHTDLAARMQFAGCRRVEVVIPSCDKEILERYECSVSMEDLAASIRVLNEHDIRVQTRFLVGGPDERGSEAERVCKAIRTLGYCEYALEPFPFGMDTPLWQEYEDMRDTPSLHSWVQWSRDPWIAEQPVAFWGGAPRIEGVKKDMALIQSTVQRSPRRILKSAFTLLTSRNWITHLENKVLSAFAPSSRMT